jgi:amidase
MTRTVRDAAIVLTVLAGVDPQDPITQESKGRLSRDYTLFLDEDGLKGKRIGVEKSFLKRHEKIDPLLEKALTQMRSKGATIVEVDLLEKIKIEGAEFTLLQYEFKDGLNRYLANSKAAVHSLKELIAFNTEHAEKVMPFFGQEILERSQERAGLDDKVYKEALQKITGVREIIDKVLKAENLDALCGPTNGPAWCTDLINGDHFTGYGMYSPAAMAGYPHITVPMGYVHDLPVGITFFGGAFHEPELISIAYAYEQASKNRVAPSFVQTMISK